MSRPLDAASEAIRMRISPSLNFLRTLVLSCWPNLDEKADCVTLIEKRKKEKKRKRNQLTPFQLLFQLPQSNVQGIWKH